MSDEEFYDAQSEASQIKSRIVTKYFTFWSRVMVPQVKRRGRRLAYFDLFAGPGRYLDGTKSTPMLILEEAIANADLASMLVTVFNDKDPDHVEALQSNIAEIPQIETLKFQPQIVDGEVDSKMEDFFADIELVPSFSFVDPFGYKGVTLRLLHGMLKDWGCDLILFFSYNRINAAIDNHFMDEHIQRLFGTERVETLRQQLSGSRPHTREVIVLESFAQALSEMGFEYIVPFTFQRADMRRTSHHLLFVTKNALAYTVMKNIMASESSESNQGVSSFTYTKSLSQDETPLLHLLDKPIEELGDDLLLKFADRTLTMIEVFQEHNVGTPFIEKNYKAALTELEVNGKIAANPPMTQRRKNKGQPTFGNDVRVTFPSIRSN